MGVKRWNGSIWQEIVHGVNEGLNAAARLLGSTAGTTPGGTPQAGDFSIDYSTPGVWVYTGTAWGRLGAVSSATPAAIGTAAAGAAFTTSRSDHVHPFPAAIPVSGITGAVTASRFAGGTTSGAPVTGTFIAGDVVISRDGQIYLCTTGGTPGVWKSTSEADLGAWTTYSPTFSGITLGNGTVVAKYMQVGRMVYVRFRLTVGSTTAFSAATLAVSLPVTPAADYALHDPLGSAVLDDSSAAPTSRISATVGYNTASKVLFLVDSKATAATVTNLVPWTWATSDILAFSCVYEAAASS